MFGLKINRYCKAKRNTLYCYIHLFNFGGECRLNDFENRILRRVVGPNRDEVTGEWRKLHNLELNELYFLPKIVRGVNR
jgi:hypothetical protein